MFFFLLPFLLVSSVISQINPSIFSQAVGPCIFGQCQPGYGCLSEQCVPLPDPQQAFGPCINGGCPRGTVCLSQQCYRFN